MKKTIKIGTRRSQLALAQTKLVADELKSLDPTIEIEFIPMSTKGDKILDKPLESFGGKGAFITEFEEAMKDGEIDLAVHSAKDMPIKLPYELAILGVSKREDVRDVLVFPKGCSKELKENSIVGTSSLRRRLLLEENTPAKTKMLRGNVNTRLAKLDNKEYDAIILACAGLKRLGLLESDAYHYEYLEPEIFIPAAGQGIIAVEGRNEDGFLKTLLTQWSDKKAAYELETEREVVRLLGSGCNEAVGAYAKIMGDELQLCLLYQYKNTVFHLKDKCKVEDRLKLAKRLVTSIYDNV